MKKLFTLLTLLVAIVTGAWADVVEVTSFKASGSSPYTYECISNNYAVNEVEIITSDVASNPVGNSQLKVPANGTLTVSAHGKNVTKVVIEWKNNPSITVTTGGGEITTSSKTTTWEGSASSVVFTTSSANQFGTIAVTYEGSFADQIGSSVTLSSLTRGLYNSSSIYTIGATSTPSVYGVYMKGKIGSDINIDTSSGTISFKSPKAMSSIVLNWTDSKGASKNPNMTPSIGTYDASTKTWSAPSGNTSIKEVTFTNAETSKYYLKNQNVVINFASSGPSLSVDPAEANPFTYVAGNGPSAAQEFTVSLANSEKAVSATMDSENYEMSKTSDGTYASTAITDLANGDKVYVRLKSGLAKGTGYDGTLTFANDDTDDVVVDLSGSVTGQTYTVEYDLNGGSGTAPQDQQEADAKFNLAAAPTKDFTTFAGWLCDVDGQTYDAGAEYTMTAEPTTFTAQWSAPTYSSTLDFAANSVEQPAIATLLASGNMISDVTGQWEALKAGKEGYGGFKVKKNNASLKFLAQAGKHVTITLGTVANNVTLKKNGTTAGTISGGSNYTGDTKMSVVAFDAGEEDMLVELVTSGSSTVTLIKIAIEDALASTNVTVGETGFATIGLPFATTLPTGVKAYAVSEVSATSVTVSDAIAAGTTIPANKGFIIVADPQTYTFNQFANDTWQGDVANKLEATGSSVKNATAAGDFYYFSIINAEKKKVGFKKCSATATLAANKAYLPGSLVPTTSNNTLSISFEGEATAINGVAEEASEAAPVKVVTAKGIQIGKFNVAGQQVK